MKIHSVVGIMQIISILGGHVWIHQEYYCGLPSLFRWGAKRKMRDMPEEAVSGERHYRIFATDTGYIAGYGVIAEAHFDTSGQGAYEFTGFCKPEIHESL